jgi:hypothetical protein
MQRKARTERLESHEIPMLEYETLSMKHCWRKELVATDKVLSIKDHVEEIKKHFS